MNIEISAWASAKASKILGRPVTVTVTGDEFSVTASLWDGQGRILGNAPGQDSYWAVSNLLERLTEEAA